MTPRAESVHNQVLQATSKRFPLPTVRLLWSDACRLAQRRDALSSERTVCEPFGKAQDRPGELGRSSQD